MSVNQWFTPNTYDSITYKELPHGPGVYAFVAIYADPINKTVDYEVLYVGSSKDIKKRCSSHEVLRILTEFYDYIRIYFIEVINYLPLEKKIIRSHQPRFNKVWKY